MSPFGGNFGGNFDVRYEKVKRLKELIAQSIVQQEREGQKQKQAKKEAQKKIIALLEEISKKLDRQNIFLQKLTSIISKMYADGEINKDTFNKLDLFLKEYYEMTPE